MTMTRPIKQMRDGELMIYAGRGAQWAKDELARRTAARQELNR